MTTTDRYLLISSDGHAGPPAELYRDYLDPKYRQQFDEHQAEMSALRELASNNDEFRKEWEAKTGDGGLHAAFDSDARNEKLDVEGVAAEVLFPDADVLGTGRVAASPFGSGLSSSGDSDARAGDGRREGSQPMARRLLRQRTRSTYRRGGRADRP